MPFTKQEALNSALEFSRQNPLRLGDAAALLADADQVYTWLNAPDAPAVVAAPVTTNATGDQEMYVSMAGEGFDATGNKIMNADGSTVVADATPTT